MTAAHTNSIALLIDADNAPAGKIEFILSELAAHGVVNIRRAYGNWTKPDLNGWIKVLHENSIQPMQSFDLVKASSDEEGWANLSVVGTRISNEGPFDHRTYGFKKLVDLFEIIDLFEVKREKHGTHTIISVRIAKVGGKKVKPKVPVFVDNEDDDNIPF